MDLNWSIDVGKKVKIEVVVPEKVANALVQIMRDLNVDENEAIRKCIAISSYLYAKQKKADIILHYNNSNNKEKIDLL
jgi:hypothetical protein